ncbi:MAG: hypothetical protein C4308_13545 [Chitinophagaceae bacterium]
MNKVFAGLTGKPFFLTIDNEGKVLEVKGFDKMFNAMIDSMPADAQAKQKAIEFFKEQFNDQQIKDQFAQLFTIFPNKSVKVGDTWEKSYSLGGRMKGNFKTVFTVKEIEGDHVTLGTKTEIKPLDEQMPMSGVQTGNIIVDSKTGLIVNAEFEQQMETKADNQTIKITGTGKIVGKAK